MLDILSYPESAIKPAMVGWGENFRIEVLRLPENAILKLVFANKVFRKRAILQIFSTEYTESVLDILLHPESNMGPP